MKYLVMECHEGYAVLMDEESRFVNAANLHYEVGQTVTEPILLETEDKQKTGGRRIVMRAMKVAAAAACLGIVTVAGFSFFGKEKPAPRSVVFVSAAAEIEMELDDKGSVVKFKSDSEQGNEIIGKYIESHGETSDKADAANALLETQLENGYISAGDTVDVLVPDNDADNYRKYKSEFEDGVSKLDINVNVKRKVDPHPNHEPPTPPAVTDIKGPAHEEATKPTASTEPAAPHEGLKHEDKATAPAVVPPTAPNEAPTPPVVPDDKAAAPEPTTHEHPEHPTPPHGEHGKEGKAGRGPAALPAPQQPAAPQLPEAPAPAEPVEAPIEPTAAELPQEADNNDMTDSQ